MLYMHKLRYSTINEMGYECTQHFVKKLINIMTTITK